MNTSNVSICPDYREFLAENLGTIFLFAVSLVAMPFSSAFHIPYINILVGLASLVLALALVTRYISLTAVTWIVNEDTICRTEGFFSKKTDYVELYRVVDYQESQTFLQKLLKVKTVTVVSTDKTDAFMEIYGISANLNLVKTIRERVEKCKQDKRIYEITNR